MDQNEIQTMIAANLVAKDEYDRLVSDELTDRGNPGPASEQAILAAERVLGRRLPDKRRHLFHSFQRIQIGCHLRHLTVIFFYTCTLG